MTFYTDGSCLANGKAGARGGYGVVGVGDDDKVKFCRAKRTEGTTNNREELKALRDFAYKSSKEIEVQKQESIEDMKKAIKNNYLLRHKGR